MKGTPRSALPPERSTSAASATTSPPAAATASIASRDDRPVVTTSSTISTRSPGSRRKPRRSSNTPCGRSTNIAGLPSARPISWPMITPPIAGETTASIASRTLGGQLGGERPGQPLGPRRVHQHPRALQVARAAQARREDEMAFEQRVGGAEFGEDLVVGHRRCDAPLGRADRAFNTLRANSALEAPESRAYRGRQIRERRPACFRSQRNVTGVTMRLIGWAIALAAAGLTPAAAQAPASTPSRRLPRRPLPPRRPPAAGRAAPAPIVYGSVGHAIPTPGIGDARRAQGHPGAGHADRPAKPRPSTTTGCCRYAR